MSGERDAQRDRVRPAILHTTFSLLPLADDMESLLLSLKTPAVTYICESSGRKK